MMLSISRGVKYLHSKKKIIHRDLKPENILMKDGHPKISDYGLSKILQGKATTCCGTPLYMAEEVVDGREYDFGADVWALGIIFLEMLRDKRITSILPGQQIPCKRTDFPSDEIMGSLPS